MKKTDTPYPSSLVTELRPDGTMEAVEVIEVPLLLSIRVKILMGIRAAVVFFARGVLTVTEWIVDLTDRCTLRFIPKQLIDDGTTARKG